MTLRVLVLAGGLAALVAFQALHGSQAPSSVPPVPPSSTGLPSGADNTVMIIWIVVGFLATLLTQIVALAKMRSDRIERRELRREQLEAALALAKMTRATADRVTGEITEARDEIAGARKELTENTALTREVGAKADAAYDAANSFKDKMDALQGEIAGLAGVPTTEGKEPS